MGGLAVVGIAILSFVAGALVTCAVGIYLNMRELRRWGDQQ